MSTLGSLAVSIIGDARDLEKTFDGVDKKIQGFGKNLQDAGKKVTNVGTGLTKTLTAGILLAGGAMLALTTKAGNFADELLDLEAATGISTDRLQQFRLAEVAAGVETDSIAKSVEMMARQMTDLDTYSKDVTISAERYGVALQDLNGDVRAVEDVHRDLMFAISEIEDPQERAIAGSAAFGRQWGEIAPVVALGREELERLYAQEVIDRDKLETANEFRRAFDELKHSVGLATMEIGIELMPIMLLLGDVIKDKIVPFIRDLIDRIAGLVKWFTDLSPETQRWIGIAIGIAAAIGPVLIIVGKLMTAIGAIVAILSIKIIIIAAVIAAIVAFGIWIYNLIKDNEELRDKISAAWEFIRDAVLEVWEALKETAQVVADFIRGIWEKHGETILAFLTIIWDQIKLMVETAINIVKGIIQFVLAIIRGDWEGAWEALLSVGEAIWNYMKKTAETIFNALKVALEFIWNAVKDKASEIWDNIKKTVVDKAREIYTNARQQLENLWNYIKGIPAQALRWGRDILQKLWDGMKQIFANLKNWFDRNVKGLLDSLNPWARRSPSLIDNIRSGVKEIEKAYASIRIPAYNISQAAGPLAMAAEAGRGYGGATINLHIGTLVADDRGLKELERRLKVIRFGEQKRGAGE